MKKNLKVSLVIVTGALMAAGCTITKKPEIRDQENAQAEAAKTSEVASAEQTDTTTTEQAAPAPVPPPAPEQPDPTKQAMMDAKQMASDLDGQILFEVGETEVSSDARQRLMELAMVLKQAPNAQVHVEGFADNTGPSSVNDELSRKRADAVSKVLIENGVSKDQIKTEGKGTAEPVADNSTPEGRDANRRAEVDIIESA